MMLFHGTTPGRAVRIARVGFRDGEGSYGLEGITLRGVFLSDRPLDCNEGLPACDLAYFLVEIPDDVLRALDAEIVEEGRRYREWVIPAAIVNRHFTDRTAYSEDALDAMEPPEGWPGTLRPGGE